MADMYAGPGHKTARRARSREQAIEDAREEATREGQHAESGRFRDLFGMTARPGDPHYPQAPQEMPGHRTVLEARANARVQDVPSERHYGVGDVATRAIASVWDMFQKKPQFTAQPAPQAEVGPPRTAMMPPSEGRVNRPSKGKGGGGAPVPAAPGPGDKGVLDDEVRQLAQEDEGVKEMKRMIGDYEKKREVNLAPVIALVDTWTGSNLSQAYQRPMSDDERKHTVLQLKEAIVKREADARYKKSYLLAMANQAEVSRLNKRDELASRERLAHIAGGYKLAGQKAPDPKKSFDRLGKINDDALVLIAKREYGNPKNPDDKDFKGYKGEVHQRLLRAAQRAVAAGDEPDLDTAYQKGVTSLLEPGDSNGEQ